MAATFVRMIQNDQHQKLTKTTSGVSACMEVIGCHDNHGIPST